MKKTVFASVIVMLLVFVSAVSFRPARVAQGPESIPDSVYTVFEKACITCHANDGNGMARSKVNFDKWDSYGKEKQASKAEDISNMLLKGKMPPSSFRKNNPDLVPTDEDVAKVNAWAKSFK